jgi:hypothetical protein
MNAKKWIVLALVIAIAAVGAVAVLAQDDDTAAATPAPGWGMRGPRGPMMGEGFGPGPRGPMMGEGFGPGPRGGMMHERGPRGGMMMMGEGLGAMAALVEEYTGLDHDAIHAARLEGQTLAELIEANGKTVDAFVAAALENASARIDALVEAGTITTEHADAMKALMEVRLTEMVNGTGLGGLRFGPGMKGI